MTIAEVLGQRIADRDGRAIDPAARAAARVAIADTVSVILLGAAEPATAIAAEVPGVAAGPGPALVLGTRQRTAALDAAFLNGIAGHACDFDDLAEIFGGHPSIPVLPAVLALAEASGAGGAALLDAYVVGVEAETRIARGVHFEHYERGWHPTATLGVFGAAAACARLLGLPAVQTATALAIAASLAAGVKSNFGSMTKPLHVGQCTRSGLLAALLAERGFTARLDAFEAGQGFLDVYNGPGRYDAARILDGWLDPPLALVPGIALKQYACCGSTHAAIDAALALRREHDLDPAAIEAVEVLTHPRRIPHTDNPTPRSPLEAKFSMQYCVARALLDGRVVLDHFEDGAYAEPAARALGAKVRVGVHPEMAARTERTYGAEVIVHARGERLSACVDHRAGRGPDDPMSEAELWAKFSDCASRTLPAERVAALWAALGDLEGVADVRALTALAEAPPAATRGAA